MKHEIEYRIVWSEYDKDGHIHDYFGFGCRVCGRFFPGDADNLPDDCCGELKIWQDIGDEVVEYKLSQQ